MITFYHLPKVNQVENKHNVTVKIRPMNVSRISLSYTDLPMLVLECLMMVKLEKGFTRSKIWFFNICYKRMFILVHGVQARR